jgi:hypothetical protein
MSSIYKNHSSVVDIRKYTFMVGLTTISSFIYIYIYIYIYHKIPPAAYTSACVIIQNKPTE